MESGRWPTRGRKPKRFSSSSRSRTPCAGTDARSRRRCAPTPAGSASPTPPRSSAGASSACCTTSTTSRTRPRTRTSTSAAESCATAAIAPEMIVTIQSHADYMKIPRDTPMKKAIYACDELTGFIGACVKVRPIEEDRRSAGLLGRQAAQGQGLRPLGRPLLRLRRRRGRRGAPRRAHRLPDRGPEADRRRDRPADGPFPAAGGLRHNGALRRGLSGERTTMSTVETMLSPRTIRARTIRKDLRATSCARWPAPARKRRSTARPSTPPGSRTAPPRTPTSSRTACRSASCSSRSRSEAEETVRAGAGSARSDMDLAPGRPPDGREPRCDAALPALRAGRVRADRVHVAQHALSRPIPAREPDFVSVYVPDWPERLIFCDVEAGLHVHPRQRLPGRGEEVDAAPGDVLDEAPRRPRPARRVEDPARERTRRHAARRRIPSLRALRHGQDDADAARPRPPAARRRRSSSRTTSCCSTRDGRAFGTEDGFYIKTEGLEPSQTVLWGAATHPTATYENIKVDDAAARSISSTRR